MTASSFGGQGTPPVRVGSKRWMWVSMIGTMIGTALRASVVAPTLAIANPSPSFRTSRLSICSPSRDSATPRRYLVVNDAPQGIATSRDAGSLLRHEDKDDHAIVRTVAMAQPITGPTFTPSSLHRL